MKISEMIKELQAIIEEHGDETIKVHHFNQYGLEEIKRIEKNRDRVILF